MALRSTLRAGAGFALFAVILVSVVALLRGGQGFAWQSLLGAAVGGFLAGVVVEWVRAEPKGRDR